MAAAIFAAGIMSGPNEALAADIDLATKAPALVTPSMPATCAGVSQFFLTDCQLSWYGVSVYGTVDTGYGYQTHGAPFNGYYPQGASYSIQKMNRQAMWTLAPSGVGASSIGIKGAESIGGDWKFIFQLEAGFDPYSINCRTALSPYSKTRVFRSTSSPPMPIPAAAGNSTIRSASSASARRPTAR